MFKIKRKLSLGHELDEDEGDDEDYSPNSGSPNPGVDDGFFVDVGTRADTDGSDVEKRPSDDDEKRNHDPYPPREFPAYNPDFNPNVVSLIVISRYCYMASYFAHNRWSMPTDDRK